MVVCGGKNRNRCPQIVISREYHVTLIFSRYRQEISS